MHWSCARTYDDYCGSERASWRARAFQGTVRVRGAFLQAGPFIGWSANVLHMNVFCVFKVALDIGNFNLADIFT